MFFIYNERNGDKKKEVKNAKAHPQGHILLHLVGYQGLGQLQL